MLIWESVALHQSGEPDDALEIGSKLLTEGSLSPRLNRLFLYFNYYDLLSRLDSGLVELVQARLTLDEGRWREAAGRFLDVDPTLLSEESMYDAYRAFRNAGYYSAGSEFFLREDIPRRLLDRAAYYAGTLLISRGAYPRALETVREGLAAEGSFSEMLLERQLLRSAAYMGNEELASVIPELSRRNSPELRSTLEEGVYFLARSSGREAGNLAELLMESPEPATAAQVAVMASQGIWPGVVPEGEALAAAQQQRADLYYRFVAHAALPDSQRMEPTELLLLSPASSEEAATGPEKPENGEGRDGESSHVDGSGEPAELHPFSDGDYLRLLELGLYDDAYEIGLAHGAALSRLSLDRAAGKLQEVGRYYEALRMLHQAGYPGELGTRERAERFYPLAYDALMRSAAGGESIDHAFWYAVVREESMFSSSVSSHAGAVGLSQLMPATAEDVASRMGLTGPQLTDPETNLAIGSRYLRMLLDRFEHPVAALAAYNAGQGRVRRWLAAAPEGMVAFHERIPFWETRHHVRKVVVSAVYYNYLYNDVTPAETVRFFFPGLKEFEG